MVSQSQKILRLAGRRGILRAKELAAHSIPRTYLARLVEAGELERVARGLYTLPGVLKSEHRSLVEASQRIPRGVVCLSSALHFHELTTEIPHEVWVAIDRADRQPRIDYPPVRIIRMSGEARTAGIDIHRIDGARVAIYSPAKTVVDCFKFRNKIGIDVAVAALRDYWRSEKRRPDELWRYARLCRVANVMRPYMEAMA